jgi:hypothetical protein
MNLESQYQHFRETCCLHLQGKTTLKIEEVGSSQALVSVYKTSQYCMLKHSNPQSQLWEVTNSQNFLNFDINKIPHAYDILTRI